MKSGKQFQSAVEALQRSRDDAHYDLDSLISEFLSLQERTSATSVEGEELKTLDYLPSALDGETVAIMDRWTKKRHREIAELDEVAAQIEAKQAEIVAINETIHRATALTNPTAVASLARIVTADELRRAKAQRAALHAAAALDWLAAIVPVRIANEEIGDALEHMHRRIAAGCSRWWIYLNLLMTVIWVSAHSFADLWKSRPKK